MECPFCKINAISNHIYFCKLNTEEKSKDKIKFLYLIHNRPDIFEYEKIYNSYIINEMSLPKIKELYNIDFKSIQFMLNWYNIPIRNQKQSFQISNDSRQNTNIKKYGAINPLCKGTKSFDKKNNSVKEKYGVDNVFQIKEIVERINNDESCLKKHGMTRKELIRNNSKKFWNSLDFKEKEELIKTINLKRNSTFKENYGGHPMKNIIFKNNFYKNIQNKYGVNNVFQCDFVIKQIKETKIDNNLIISDEFLEPFFIYKRDCIKLTKRNVKTLLKNWDGYDYYDGEYIKDNFNLKSNNRLYPTIDHKKSIFYGFINNIRSEEISDINNLCYTKKCINSKKWLKCEEEFKKTNYN